jgi:hypothetical protein
VIARGSSTSLVDRHELLVAVGALPLAATAGQEDTKEKKKL